MPYRILPGVTLLSLVLWPGLAGAQSQDPNPPLARVSIQAAAGPLLKGGGHTVSAGLGFSPWSRLDVLINVQRDELPFQRDTFSDRYSVTRGGSLTTISGELRASLFPPHRPSPFVLAGIGGGVSRPTVNEQFPDAIENQLRTVYFGAGVRVPLKGGISIVSDARAMLALEGDDGILGVWPIRVGLVWRF